MNINLYIENHGKLAGIEDYISILRRIFESRGHGFELSQTLEKDKVNIVIDEFTNYVTNQNISDFRRSYPQAKLILLITEFIEKKHFVTSFNHFGGLLDSALISVLKVLIQRRRADFGKSNGQDYFLATIFSPLLIIFVAKFILRKAIFVEKRHFISVIHQQVYMVMRYLGLLANMKHFDYYIFSHEDIRYGFEGFSWFKSENVIGILHPEFDIEDIQEHLLEKKQLFFEVTGSVTPYRQSIINIINRSIIVLGLQNSFGLCQVFSFQTESSANITRGAFSIHPPQTRGWKYCSPTRLYRALQVDHNIPVILKNFQQHSIENVSMTYESETSLLDIYRAFKDKKFLVDIFLGKIRDYQEKAKAENDKWVNELER